MTGRYEVEAVVGRGSMGVVYRARQVGAPHRLVAFKRVPSDDPVLLERLRREGEILASLDHPSIVRVHEVIEDTDGLGVVMQYAGGGALRDRLDLGPLPAADAATILIAVADALACAHDRGVLHRDVKPGNILFTADGHPLLSDFGVARRRGDAPLTEAGAVSPATAEYLDPAVAEGGAYDERSDLYALGIVGYEILTGSRPFPGDTPLAVIRAADRGAAVPLADRCPGVPPALAAAVEQAFARESAQRPQSAAAFAASLRSAIAALPSAVAALPSAVAPVPPHDDGATDPPLPRLRTTAARDEPPTRLFGPRPPAAPEEEPTRLPWRRVAAVAATMALLPSLAVLGIRERERPAPQPAAESHGETAPVAPAILPAAAALPTCPGVTIPRGTSRGSVLTGDLDGSGCRSWIRARNGRLTVQRPRGQRLRLHLGQRDDTILLGDWDCNGTDTAALYSAATGVVYEFDTWPQPEQRLRSSSKRATGIIRGVATTALRNGCDTVEVMPALDT